MTSLFAFTDAAQRRLAFILCAVVPLSFGVLALALGQDANWDLRNYHWYNPYAFLHDRWTFDVTPSTYYNPLPDLPVFLLGQVLSARAVSFVLGAVQGLNFILLFLLARAVLVLPAGVRGIAIAGAVAFVGMIGGGNVGLIGTTFNDNIISLAVIGAILIVVAAPDVVFRGPLRAAFMRVAIAGLVLGAGVGLKLPMGVFAVGFCLAFLFIAGAPWRRLFLAFFFGVGVLVGVGITAGHWMWQLWTELGNPLFPYFNDFFKSPMAVEDSYRDTRFIPKPWLIPLFPFIFGFDGRAAGEIAFRDLRIATAYVVLFVAAIGALLGRRADTTSAAVSLGTRYVMAACAISFAVWMPLFAIYRYIIPLEMLAPLVIVAAVGFWPLTPMIRARVSAALLLFVTLTAWPGSWIRLPIWTDKLVEVTPPPIPNPADTLVVMVGYEPLSYVIPAFPPQIPFLRLQGYGTDPKDGDTGLNRLLKTRLERHAGDIYLLNAEWERDKAAAVLPYFGLKPDFERCLPIKSNIGLPAELCAVSR